MEAQDAANNTQTGIEMGLVKSFMQYALRVRFFPLHIFALHNPRNEVSHSYLSRNARHIHAAENDKRA
jgi:hypothetical protein